jgi:hypothetical protein
VALRGPTPRVYTLSLRTQPERGGPVRAAVEDKDGLETNTDWRHLLLLVHGFNNSESQAEKSYEGYIDILRPGLARSRVAPDAVAKLHWPGNAAVGPFPILDFAGYPVDVERALQSVLPLGAFLASLMARGPSGRLISIVGHSLGCRLIVETMRRLRANAGGTPLAIVSLMAAAVPVALAETGKPLAEASTAAKKVLKAHSRSDWVLWLAFPPGQWLAYIGHIEQKAYVEAMGRNGNPSGFGERLDRKGNGHSDYWSDQYAAAVLLVTMDATLRAPLEPAKIAKSKLPVADGIGARKLELRTLPS